VNTLLSAGTVEEKIDTVLQDKQALADLTVGHGEDWLAQLDDDRLLDLLSLDEEEDR
jgi:SNF2 family DNA or RNA helicase